MKRKVFLLLALSLSLSMSVWARPFASPGDELDAGTTYDILGEDALSFENMDRDEISNSNYTLEYHLETGGEAVKSLRINATEATVELTTADVIPVDGLVEIRGELTLTSRKRTRDDGSFKSLTYDIDFSIEGDGAEAAEEEGDGLTPSERLLRQWGYDRSGETPSPKEQQPAAGRNPNTGR